MPKPHTFPFIFDQVKSIDISLLRKWGYLNHCHYKSGTLTWSTNGIETSNISIATKMNTIKKVLILSYNCNDKSYKYEVPLVSLPSNLGKGIVWYFLCPFTKKRCRKLHFIDQRFIHRSALPSGMYEKQIQSKKWRQMDKAYGFYFDSNQHYQELYGKYFKKYYNGKPTKRYLKLMAKINRSESIPYQEIEKAMCI
ncbi:hypothetical protein GCM10022393_27680 [Aquimarina addita]|uniref:Uncharacterized protein n=1 Tax=Aquimarina addita TaxID=870485 RepID=A0ABP6UQ13_9FLAO